MNILVTGGSGFLGKRLVRKLLDEGQKVTVFSQDGGDFPKGVKICRGDVRSIDDLSACFGKFDVVYHLAACLNEDDPAMWSINVNGTKNVANLCKKNRVKQLVFMSSSGVLGETRVPAKEDFPYNPKTRYEKSKMECEKIVISSGVPYTIIRTTIIIGPNIVWAKIFEAARRGYPIIGSGKNYFHLVYIDDVVRFLAISRSSKKALNNVFHVASKDIQTYNDVYSMICQEMGCAMTKKHIPLHLAYAMAYFHRMKRKLQGRQPSITMMRSSIDRLVRNRVISIDKANKLLGFEPQYSTQQALHETIGCMRIAKLGYSDYDLSEIRKIKPSK